MPPEVIAKIGYLAAEALQEIAWGLPPRQSPRLQELYRQVSIEPLYDPLGYYASGDVKWKDSAFDACAILASETFLCVELP